MAAVEENQKGKNLCKLRGRGSDFTQARWLSTIYIHHNS